MLTAKRGEPAADRSRGFTFHEVVGSHFCKQRKGGMLPDEKICPLLIIYLCMLSFFLEYHILVQSLNFLLLFYCFCYVDAFAWQWHHRAACCSLH